MSSIDNARGVDPGNNRTVRTSPTSPHAEASAARGIDRKACLSAAVPLIPRLVVGEHVAHVESGPADI